MSSYSFSSDSNKFTPTFTLTFTPTYSLDAAIVATTNGNKHTPTTLPQLISLIANLGFSHPSIVLPDMPNLDLRGQEIGRGGQFTVFCDSIREGVVYKRVNETVFAKKAHLRTLETEILALCHPPLREHPNIVNLISWGLDYPRPGKALPYLIMERAESSLAHFVRKDSKAELDWVVKHQLCLDVADGLSTLHANGIVHGDIKPENILIFKTDGDKDVPYIAKLSDFGVCIDLEESVNLDFGAYCGTDGWIGPEIMSFSDESISEFKPELLFRSDSFAFGLLVLAVFATYGESPLKQKEHNESFHELSERLIQNVVHIPQGFRLKLIQVLFSVLKDRPEERALVTSQMLADKSKSYNDWTLMRLTKAVENDRVLGVTQGLSWWRQVDPYILEQIEEGIKNDTTILTGEALFGIAISHTHLRKPGFQDKFLKYLEEAANASYAPAQGLMGVLYHNGFLPLPNEGFADIVETWLYNAASTGSLISLEALQARNKERFADAIYGFRLHGGYNKERLTPEAHKVWLETIKKSVADNGHARFVVDRKGNTPLHIAAIGDDHECIEYLVNKMDAQFNDRNYEGETPLYKACLAGNAKAVEALISYGADASIAATEHNLTPLHWLFVFDESEILHIANLLVSQGGANVDSCSSYIAPPEVGKQVYHNEDAEHFPFHWPSGTAIHWAAFARSKPALEVLLSLGADIDAKDDLERKDAQTALAMTAQRGDAEMIRFLISKGANALIIDGHNRNCLSMLTADHSISKIFRNWKGLCWWLYHGPYEKHFTVIKECVNLLNKEGVNLDGTSQTEEARTWDVPLLMAVNALAPDCAAIVSLLDAGANDSTLSKFPHSFVERFTRQSILHKVVMIDNRVLPYPEAYDELLAKVLEHTADKNSVDSDGYTAINNLVHASAITEDEFEKRLRVLVKHGADTNIGDRRGRSPLFNCLLHWTPGVAIKRTASILRVSPETDQLLREDDEESFLFELSVHYAINDHDTLILLKQFMAPYDTQRQRQLAQQSHKNRSTAMKAIHFGKFEFFKYFVELGVDINWVSKSGKTCLDYAVERGEDLREIHITLLTERVAYAERDTFERDASLLDHQNPRHYSQGPQLDITSEIYFAQPKIINYIRDIGGKMGVEVGQKINEDSECWYPTVYDMLYREALQQLGAGSRSGSDYLIQRQQQPFYEQWKILYELQEVHESFCWEGRAMSMVERWRSAPYRTDTYRWKFD